MHNSFINPSFRFYPYFLVTLLLIGPYLVNTSPPAIGMNEWIVLTNKREGSTDQSEAWKRAIRASQPPAKNAAHCPN